MRPIKFRGKRVDNEEWVYGDKIDVCNKRFIIPKPYHPTGFIGWVVGGLIEVISETVGQYIKNDKNGKEIYEIIDNIHENPELMEDKNG